MSRTMTLRQPVRPQHAAQARVLGTTKPPPAATAALSPLVPLQHRIGNQAVGRLVQARLKVGRPGDRFEREADRIADEVMRAGAERPEPQHGRACPCGGECPKCQTEQPGREHEGLQTKRVQASDTGQIAAPPIVHEVLRSPGQPLDPVIRAFMEPRFGHDFSKLRLHTDARAAKSAKTLGAHAYTIGQSLVFGAGEYAPQSVEGSRLLAHELTHVVQQAGGISSLVQRDVTSDIPIDSADFWTHLRSRTFTRLVGWIGDSRQKLNEFVDIMGDTDTPSPWGSVALSWIQVFGTAGDIVNALVATIQTVGAKVDSPSTLFEFRNTLERNFDALSVRVNNLASDLPIYEALRQTETKANTGTQDERRANRHRAQVELERALDRLPSPDSLKQTLVQRWIATAGRTKHDATIYYETSYRAYRYDTDFLRLGPDDRGKTRLPLLRRTGSDYFVGEANQVFKPAMLLHVRRPEQTIKALQNAYGTSALLHKLPFPMTIKFWGVGTSQLGGTPHFSWKRDPVSRVWAPEKGLGSEEQDAVFQDWYDRGVKPSLANLQKQ